MSELTITLEPHLDDHYIRIRVRGKLTAPETLGARTQVVAEHPGFHRLWDFLDADLSAWTGDDMRMFIDLLRRTDRLDPTVRVAALVSREVDYGRASLFKSLSADTLPGHWKVFRDEADAVHWVSTGAGTLPGSDTPPGSVLPPGGA